MPRVTCVEFTRGVNEDHQRRAGFGWRLRGTNGQIIATPHESFVSHRNAIESFRRVADALDMRAIIEIRDAPGVRNSHALLTA